MTLAVLWALRPFCLMIWCQRAYPPLARGLRTSRFTILGARYLVINQSANRRHNSKTSKIWQDGMELRALDSTNLDKYWLCNHCLPTTQIYKIMISDGNSNTAAPI